MKNLKVKQKWLAVMTALAAFLTSSPVFAGIGLMLSQKMREWAKGHIVYVIIGVVVIVLASQAVPFIQQMFGG